MKVGLVDSLETSDNYLVNLSKEAKLLEIEFVENFIMTSSGKINRRILREIENKQINI